MKTILWTTNNKESSAKLFDHLNYLKAKNGDKQVDYMVTIKKNLPVRSISDNGYYWLVLTAIANHTGDTKEDLHSWYKLEFNSHEFRGKMIPTTTTDLDTAEHKIYVEKVKHHGRTFHGAYIADRAAREYAVWAQVTKEKYDATYLSL